MDERDRRRTVRGLRRQMASRRLVRAAGVMSTRFMNAHTDTGTHTRLHRSATTKESPRMSPTFRPRPASSRSPHGTRRRVPRAGLIVVITGVLVLLLAACANAATVLEEWGSSPAPLQAPEGATAAALGSIYDDGLEGNSFVLTPSGVFSAGSGWLGFGGEEVAAPYRLIPGTAGATAVAAYFGEALILQSDGTVLAINASQPTPTPIAGLSDVTAITSSLALEANGSVWTVSGTPTQIALPEKAAAIAAGSGEYSYGDELALLENGSV